MGEARSTISTTQILWIVTLISALLSLQATAGIREGREAYQRGDFAAAFRELEPLAEQGNAEAAFYLGYMYAHGQAVTRDYKEAVAWYRRAAEQGDSNARSNLGFMYNVGRGVPRDHEEALKWNRQAAEQGNVIAQRSLGMMFEVGAGVQRDYGQSYTWYFAAASRNDRRNDTKSACSSRRVGATETQTNRLSGDALKVRLIE